MKNILVNLLVFIFLTGIGVLIFGATLGSVWRNPTIQDIKENVNTDPKPFGVSPERNRFILTMNLVENKSFAMNRNWAEAASPDVGYIDGRYYVYFAPGMSVLAMPFYVLGSEYNLSWLFTSGMVGLFAIANLLVIFLIAKQIIKLPYWSALFSSLVFGFASTALSYATTLYQHQSTAFFIIFGFYSAWQYRIHKKWGFMWGFVVWLCYGLAISIDYPNAILMLPAMIYFLLASIHIKKSENIHIVSVRWAIVFSSIFFVGIVFLLAYYNYANFGNWTKLSGTSLIGIKTIEKQELQAKKMATMSAALKHATGSESAKPISRKSVSPVSFFREINLAKSSYELLIAPDKGIFFFSPIFLFGVFGIFIALKKKVTLETASLIALIVVNIFLYSSWGDPWGGWAFGPRYLIPAMAILSIFVSYTIVNAKYKYLAKLTAYILTVFSAGVAILGAITTTAVPPAIEAIPLKSPYGFFYNALLLVQGKSNVFIFNYFLKNHLDLQRYFLVLLGIVAFVFFIVLFIMPLFSKQVKENKLP